MFGRGIAEHFMLPYSHKFWGLSPDKLTTDWVNVRHPKPSLEEVISGALHDQDKGFGINATFQYPKEGGFGFIAEALAKNCLDRINLGMKATFIDPKNKEVTFNEDLIISYEKLLSTIPLPEILKLLPEVPDEVVDASNNLKTNSVFVVNLGINREKITDKSWIYFLEKEFIFFRISFPFNFLKNSHAVVPPGHSSISAEIAYGNDNALPYEREKIPQRVIKDLIKVGIIEKTDQIVYQDTYDINYGYVIFDQRRKKSIKVIHKFLKSLNIIPCGRYGLWAYLWSDEAILSGKKVAEKYN